jgi:ABC-type branched-subunit amino acid transport system ATPase component
VTITSKDQVGTGDRGVYEKSESKVYLYGNVTLSEGTNVTRGDRLVLHARRGGRPARAERRRQDHLLLHDHRPGAARHDRGTSRSTATTSRSLPMYRRARLGIGYLPQEASIFRGLTSSRTSAPCSRWSSPTAAQREERLEALLEEFDIGHLRKRRRSRCRAASGGACEIARALADPALLHAARRAVRRHRSDRRRRHPGSRQPPDRRGIGVLITDHNVRETLGLIDRAYIIRTSGRC